MTANNEEDRTTQAVPSSAAYRDAALAIETRVDDLITWMTLNEKLAQLGGIWSSELLSEEGFSATSAARLMPDGTGQITRIAAIPLVELWSRREPDHLPRHRSS